MTENTETALCPADNSKNRFFTSKRLHFLTQMPTKCILVNNVYVFQPQLHISEVTTVIQTVSKLQKTDRKQNTNKTNSFLHAELKFLLRMDHCLAV